MKQMISKEAFKHTCTHNFFIRNWDKELAWHCCLDSEASPGFCSLLSLRLTVLDPQKGQEKLHPLAMSSNKSCPQMNQPNGPEGAEAIPHPCYLLCKLANHHQKGFFQDTPNLTFLFFLSLQWGLRTGSDLSQASIILSVLLHYLDLSTMGAF